MKKILIVTLGLLMSICMSSTVLANGESDSILSAANSSTYVIKDDGSLWGCGLSYVGNGNGYKEPVIVPVKVLDNVRSVSANAFTTIAVKKDDTLWGWGSFAGYIGEDQNPSYLYPTKFMDDILMAANGDNYIMVLKNDHTLWVGGNMVIGDGTNTKADSDTGFVKVMSNVKSISAGEDTVYVIKNDDTLWGWGDNSNAQLGNRSDTGDNNVDTEFTPVKILDDVKFVSNSGSTVIAVRLDGSLYSWGKGGSKGIYTENGWVENAGTPYKVMDDVVMGTMRDNGSGILVVKTDGTLWGWNNQWNDEGNRQTPYKYADNVSRVSVGERHAAIVKKDNTMWTMGGNYRYGLGYESNETWYTPLTKVLDNIQDAPASWAGKEVETAIGLKLIPEDMQGNYTKIITREEFCVLAIKMIEVKSGMDIEDYIRIKGVTIASSNTFVDTTNKDILAAKTLGITEGTSPTTFNPDNQLTREQAAKFLSSTARVIGEDITATCPAYVDEDTIANWAKPYIGYVYNVNVMKGVGANRFDPRGGYQRQQAYLTMTRLFNSIEQVNMDEKVVETEIPVDTYTDVAIKGIEKLVFYKVKSIDTKEETIDGGAQIKYYSEESYDNLIEYFKNLLEGTTDYWIIEGDEKTTIVGTIDEREVVVIVKNFMKYEPEVEANGLIIGY